MLATAGLLVEFDGYGQLNAACPTPTFGPANYYASKTGGDRRGVVVGDLNLDGRLDLVVADWSAGTITVLLGQGNGMFKQLAEYTSGAWPTYVAIVDLNHDGKPDVVASCENSGGVSVFLGNGTGVLGARRHFAADQTPRMMAFGDFNRDGHPDLAVACFGSSNRDAARVAILDGNGDGTFRQPARVVATACCGTWSVVTADFDEDGMLDLVVGNNEEQVLSFVKGNGDGTFRAPAKLPVSAGNAYGLATAELDGDGHMDLVVSCGWARHLVVLKGGGNGTFSVVLQTIPLNVSSFPMDVQLADVTGDGYQDIAVALSDDDAVGVAAGDGTGHFGPVVFFAVEEGPHTVAMGDFNADGATDLAVGPVNGSGVAVMLNACVMSPRITEQPRNQMARCLSEASFHVTADGSTPFSYQWYKQDAAIDGATNATLLLTALSPNDAGRYSVEVRNAYGKVRSDPAFLVVSAAGLTAQLYLGLTIEGTVGAHYAIQVTTNLFEPNWTTLTNLVLPTPVMLWQDTQPVVGTTRYYRVDGPCE